MDQKEKIYAILKTAEDVFSGEKISGILGISRVAVWKHVRGMIQSGIPIVSSPRGYHLTSDPDSLLPWEFGTRQDRIHHFQKISSTMDEATNLARQGCPDFTVVVAERQTLGRGRMNRTWFSGDGGLYFTVVVRPNIPIASASLVNLAAAVELATILRSLYDVPASLKWPNDILVNEAKICGILSQMETEGDRISHLRIGIGLNVNNRPELDEPRAVSLRKLVGSQVPRRQILVEFLSKFEKRLINFDVDSLITEWRLNNTTIGRHVTITTLKGTVEGTAVDIEQLGGLVLQLVDGSRETVIHGDCFHI